MDFITSGIPGDDRLMQTHICFGDGLLNPSRGKIEHFIESGTFFCASHLVDMYQVLCSLRSRERVPLCCFWFQQRKKFAVLYLMPYCTVINAL